MQVTIVIPASLHDHLVHSRFINKPVNQICADQPHDVSSNTVGSTSSSHKPFLSIGHFIKGTET